MYLPLIDYQSLYLCLVIVRDWNNFPKTGSYIFPFFSRSALRTWNKRVLIIHPLVNQQIWFHQLFNLGPLGRSRYVAKSNCVFCIVILLICIFSTTQVILMATIQLLTVLLVVVCAAHCEKVCASWTLVTPIYFLLTLVLKLIMTVAFCSTDFSSKGALVQASPLKICGLETSTTKI